MDDNDELEGNGLTDEEVDDAESDDESDAVQQEQANSSSPRDNI